ncbi:MAG: universal stress protein [Acidobacteriaceae bacterium]|jgi:nucleotide-binding universal stress UspA family protein|nr:universal stress protein [Acidobacteriaceae bacterium]
MAVFKKVLVTTDFSELSQAALNYGRELARRYHAALHVLHVADDMRWRYSDGMGVAMMVGVQADLEEYAKNYLSTVITNEDRTELHAVTAVVTAPNPALAIIDYAAQEQVDLIVMGTHGRGPVTRMLMGSVAERVVRAAPCPVLTVRGRDVADPAGSASDA